MIPAIKDIEKGSLLEKRELLARVRSMHSINEICNSWGISLGTYYNILRRWGINLSELRRDKRIYSQDRGFHINESRAAADRFSVALKDELDGETLLNFLHAIRLRLATSRGPFQVELSIRLADQESEQVPAFLPIEEFSNLDMVDKVRRLAGWIKSDDDKEELLKAWEIDKVQFYELLGKLKIPMSSVLEEKHRLANRASISPVNTPPESAAPRVPDDSTPALYELSGACERQSLEMNVRFLAKSVKHCAKVKYRVGLRIEEIDWRG